MAAVWIGSLSLKCSQGRYCYQRPRDLAFISLCSHLVYTGTAVNETRCCSCVAFVSNNRRIPYLPLLIVLVLFFVGFILKLANIVHEYWTYISPEIKQHLDVL